MTSPLLDEVVDAMLPGKASKLQVRRNKYCKPTQVISREYQGT